MESIPLQYHRNNHIASCCNYRSENFQYRPTLVYASFGMCDVISRRPIVTFHEFRTWLKEQGREMKDKRNHHGAVGKSSSEQHFCKFDTITFTVLNFWSRTPSTTGSYGRLAEKIQVIFENFKFHNRSK